MESFYKTINEKSNEELARSISWWPTVNKDGESHYYLALRKIDGSYAIRECSFGKMKLVADGVQEMTHEDLIGVAFDILYFQCMTFKDFDGLIKGLYPAHD